MIEIAAPSVTFPKSKVKDFLEYLKHTVLPYL